MTTLVFWVVMISIVAGVFGFVHWEHNHSKPTRKGGWTWR